MSKAEIVKEALARFPDLPARAIARYLFQSNPALFGGEFERARSAVKYYIGACGDRCRQFRPPIERNVSMPETWRQNRVPYKLPAGKWLILSDLHIPFHEPLPIESALQYGKDNKVTGILLNGDAQDCAAVSFWPSVTKRNFDREVELFVDFLDLLKREFPKAQIVYKPGNHEYRLPRMYAAKIPDLIGVPLAAMDAVLGLESRGIEFLDYHQIIMAGKLPILHGHEVRIISRAVNPARGLFLKTKSWAMCGHSHTTSEHTERDIRGTILTTWSVGCLCDLSPDYHAYGNNWNWGVAIVENKANGDFTVDNRRILPNGSVV